MVIVQSGQVNSLHVVKLSHRVYWMGNAARDKEAHTPQYLLMSNAQRRESQEDNELDECLQSRP